jgi:hypothetical protein
LLPISFKKSSANNSTRNADITKENKAIITDSPINCFLKVPWLAPLTFLIPTSLKRVLALATEILIKLNEAINRIIRAIPEKIKIYRIFVTLAISDEKSE